MEAELNSEPDAAPPSAALKLVGGADLEETGASKADLGDADTGNLETGSADIGKADHGDADPAREREVDLSALTPDEKSKTLLDLILHELAEDKAEDVVTIDLGGKSEIADAMVIASGRSQRHVSAIADKVSRRLKAAKAKNVRCEGQPACDWVLIDAGDVILHLFRPEVRAFYNLERIWSETAHAASGPTT